MVTKLVRRTSEVGIKLAVEAGHLTITGRATPGAKELGPKLRDSDTELIAYLGKIPSLLREWQGQGGFPLRWRDGNWTSGDDIPSFVNSEPWRIAEFAERLSLPG